MRGEDERPAAMWTYIRLEERVPKDHPLRAIRRFTDKALAELDPVFERMHKRTGRHRRARVAAAGPRAAAAVQRPQRAPPHGAPRSRPALPLVRRARHRHGGLGPLDLQPEPRQARAKRSSCPPGGPHRCGSAGVKPPTQSIARAMNAAAEWKPAARWLRSASRLLSASSGLFEIPHQTARGSPAGTGAASARAPGTAAADCARRGGAWWSLAPCPPRSVRRR